MREPLRVFGLLMCKNFIVRKRHWRLTIFLQVLVPIALFMLTQAVRDFSAQPPLRIENDTYYPIETEEDLMDRISRDMANVFYYPSNKYTRTIMAEVRECLSLLDENTIGFNSEDDMLDAYIKQQAEEPFTYALAVVFDENEQGTDSNFKYKIRHSVPIPDTLFQTVLGERLNSVPMIYTYRIPFVQLQLCVDKSLINQTVPGAMSNVKFSIERMPYPPYVKIDEADVVLRQVICMFAVIAFLIPLCIEASFSAKEKFIGVNVLMEMNGVKVYQNLLSWLLTGIIFSILYVVPIIILFKNTFSSNVEPYLYYGNSFIFWELLTTHVAHLIAFGMHVSAYFSKQSFVITTLSIIYTASFSLHGNLIRQGCLSLIPYLGILFPNMLLYRLLEELNVYEGKLVGIQWSNLFYAGDAQYNVTGSAGFVYLFSLLGMVLHFTLAVYVNAVRPGKYGVRKHPLYFLKCGRKNKVFLDEEAGDFDYDKVNGEDFEAVTAGVLTPGIQIRDLKKTYCTSFLRKSTVQALKGISVDFYKGQITALLGHNGAGKTTLMSILTGVTSETAGKVFINGRNVQKDLETIRNDLGLCPQENMVFPDLNVFEQIEFFGRLKNKRKTKQQLKHEVNVLLDKLKLLEKRDTLPSKLSGGQKRRLCLGMALIGDASTLILDEPTSGMDPETRRDTWDIILKLRGEKTILISTHNMEEADILGDRIAIVHGGRLRSYGTSMFLKKQYGNGHLEITLSTKSWCTPEKVTNKFDGKAQPVTIDSEKIVLSVPYTESLPDTLDKIESQKKKLGVTGISVSLITLEQVFLKIVKKEEECKRLTEMIVPSSQKLRGWPLCINAALALLEKKATFTRKNLLNLLMTIFLPVLSVVLMGLSYDIPEDSTHVYPLKLNIYRSPKVFYASDDHDIGRRYEEAVKYFGGYAKSAPPNTTLASALLRRAVENIAEYRNNFVASAEFLAEKDGIHANGLYSGIAIHGMPLTVNLMTNALIKSMAGPEYTIELSSQQLPSTLASTRLMMPEGESLSRVLIFCAFFFPTLALFVLHPLQETATKVKQLQRMTGVTASSYWGTMFAFDMAVYIVCVGVIVFGLYAMDVILDIRLFRQTEILTISLILLLFGVNALCLTYIFSFANKSKNTIMTILSLAPVGLVLLQYLLHEVIHNFDNLRVLHAIQKRIFRLIPYVSFFHGQLSFYNVAVQNARCRRLPNRLHDVTCAGGDICCGLECSNGTCAKPLPYFRGFDDDISLEENILFLGLTPLLYAAILIMLEEKVFAKLFSRMVGTSLRDGCESMDEQVKKEKRAVAVEISKLSSHNSQSGKLGPEINAVQTNDALHSPEGENANLFLVYELSKYYGKLMAVKEVNFRVKQRECFGLLGVNGAGKSTTFRMLTGEEMPNSGYMYLAHAEIHSDRRKYLAEMGYCPQTDALLNSLNAFDHLRLFARLRGIPRSKVDLEVNKWINRLNLNACMKQPSSTYSGGNKRRLNIAMALIGNPTLVLLDEPTTGVDPAARRSLWNVLQSCQAAGQAIILTSHSMEECEALCNRLVIMVKGQLVCIGASQELKQRFGAGYDINIKLNPARSEEEANEIKRVIESTLTCEIRDENLGFIAYHVIDCQTAWKDMYGTMNGLKARFRCIEDFSVLSATLEQLFIQFARGTETSDDVESPKNAASRALVV